MKTAYITHPDCLRHEMGPGHPECPGRLGAVNEQMRSSGMLDELRCLEAPLAGAEDLKRVHRAAYVDLIFENAPSEGYVQLDPDTAMNPHSLGAARRAAGAGLLAVDEVHAGRSANAFCAVRPCGHHATQTRSMGFCIFNNVGVAAAYALEKKGLERVAVIDFDVHHGNGTEAILLDRPGVAFFSIHQFPCYPGTGTANAGNNCFNYPVEPFTPRETYRATLARALDDLKDFRPDLVAVSAGFDAYLRDPLVRGVLVLDDFYWIGQSLRALGVPMFSLLEGGYSRELPELIFAYLKGVEGK